MEVIEVADEAQAARLGTTGSPTILVDGIAPFAVPGAAASVSCRLYRGSDWRAEGAPPVTALQQVLCVTDAAERADGPPLDEAGASDAVELDDDDDVGSKDV